MLHGRAPIQFSAVVLIILVSACSCVAAPRYDISYVVEKADQLANTAVSVEGIVLEVELAEQPARHKYEYILQDEKTGDQLRVLSLREAQANAFKTVVGTVGRDALGVPFLTIKSAWDLSDWRLWALGFLLIAAVVLVIMLVRPGATDVPLQSESSFEAFDQSLSPVGSGLMLCPECGKSIAADSRFCEICGADLTLGAEHFVPGGATVAVATDVPAMPSKTVMLSSGPDAPSADLVVTESPSMQPNSRWILTGRNEKLGRSATMDVRLADDGVSTEHAMLWWDADSQRYLLQDSNSTNGTFVNGERTSGRTQLSDGDEIRMGRTTLRFRMNPEAARG